MFENPSENRFVIVAVHNSNNSHETHMYSETQDQHWLKTDHTKPSVYY